MSTEEGEKIISSLSNEITKIFRYIVPGGVFIILLYLSGSQMFFDLANTIKNAHWTLIALMVLVLGMVIYAAHRCVLSCVEVIFLFRTKFTAVEVFRKSDEKYEALGPWASFLIDRHTKHKDEKELFGFLEYRCSLAHSFCIVGELIILVTFFAKNESFLSNYSFPSFIVGGLAFIIGLLSLLIIYNTEKHISRISINKLMDKSFNPILFKNALVWGFILWLIGYGLGIILFFFVPANLLGWAIMPIGILITLWVLFKKVGANSWRDYLILAIVWTLIAIICDYFFLVKLLNPADGYYKLDVYLYYIITFALPLIFYWNKKHERKV